MSATSPCARGIASPRYSSTSGTPSSSWTSTARTIGSLKTFGPDVVWPLVHGGPGEDGGLQNVLISLGLPYVGTHSDGCQRASFKPTAKASVRTGGVITPDSLTLPQSYFSQLGAQEVLTVVAGHLGLPVVVKPHRGAPDLVSPTHRRRTSCAPQWWRASPTTSAPSSSVTSPGRSWRSLSSTQERGHAHFPLLRSSPTGSMTLMHGTTRAVRSTSCLLGWMRRSSRK